MSDGMVEITEAEAPAQALTAQRRKRGKGSLYKRPHSAVWWMATSYRGRPIRESTKETDKKKAQEKLNAKLIELGGVKAGHGVVITPKVRAVTVKMQLDALLLDYDLRKVKSMRQVQTHLGYPPKHRPDQKPSKILAAFGHWRCVDLTEAAVDRYVHERLAQDARPSTVNRETQLLGQALRPFFEKTLRQPMLTIRRLSERDNARQGFFERADFEAVLAHIEDTDLQDFLHWFFWTGMRPGEIRRLTWAAFDRETWTLRLHAKDAKTGYGRVIPLEAELRAVIERRIAARRLDCAYIFHRGGRPLGEFRKTWARACRAAGLTGKLVYDLRRTSVRNQVRAGVPERVVMAVSGHRTRAVFDRYNITSEDDLRAAMQRTSTYVNGLPTERRVLPMVARS